METNYKNNLSYRTAKKRVSDIKGFYIHLTVYLFINIAIFIVSTRDEGILKGLTNITNYSTFFFWGIGIVAHWASVFGSNFILGKEWEECKIRQLMNQDNKKIWK